MRLKKYLLFGILTMSFLFSACGNAGEGTLEDPYHIGDTAEISADEYTHETSEGKIKITIDNVDTDSEVIDYIEEQVDDIDYRLYENEDMSWVLFNATYELTDYVNDNDEYTVYENVLILNENGDILDKNQANISDAPRTVMSGNDDTKFESEYAFLAPAEEDFIIRINGNLWKVEN